MQMGTGNTPSTSTQTRNPGRRVAYKDDDDNWSLFSNPDCLHDRPCGHNAGPPVSFKPAGVGSDKRAFESPNGPTGTQPLFSGRTPPYSQTPNPDFRRGLARKDMGHPTGAELPSQIGPFLLKSQSSGSSLAEGREYRFPSIPLYRSYSSTRTIGTSSQADPIADWDNSCDGRHRADVNPRYKREQRVANAP
jgi:hypothetical protein